MVIDEVRPEGGGADRPTGRKASNLSFLRPGADLRPVLWNKEDDENLKKVGMVKVYVNGLCSYSRAAFADGDG